MAIFDVNWLAVVLAALAGFVVGGLWYGPIMGKTWMGAAGITEEDMKNTDMVKLYGSTFALSLLASWTMAHMFSYLGDISFGAVVLTAFGVALGFILPALWTNYLFQGANRKLYFIDGGYWLLFYTAMGCVHAALPNA